MRDPPASLTQPADDQGEEGMEEEVVFEHERGRHSRPAALRTEEPGSASLQTEPVLFSGGQTQSGHDCAPYVSEGEVPYLSVRLPETTPETSRSHL